MGRPYVPPGVTITEAVSPQVVPLLASSAEIVLAGLSLGYQTRTDQVVLLEEGGKGVPVKLPFLASVEGSKLIEVLAVYNAINPAEGENEGKGYKATTYKVTVGEGTIELIAGKGIEGGTLVNVTYKYIPGDYWNPVRLFTFNEVQNRFGNALENGTITSPLSLAAQKALEGGAGSVILQPLFMTPSHENPIFNHQGFITNAKEPTAEENAEAGTWTATFQALQVVEAIDLITPVIGQSQEHVTDGSVAEIEKVVLGFEQKRLAEQQYVYGVFGEDSTTGDALASTIRSHAQGIRAYANGTLSSQNLLINTGSFNISLPSTGELAVGAQYVAASIAGQLAGSPVARALTRKGVVGFTKVNDIRTPEQKNVDAGEGLFVVEQVAGGFIRCRHAISIDNSHGAARSEVSVVRAKFLMVESVKETLENQIIGQIIADANSPIIVRSAIVGVLSALQSAGDLVDFQTPVVQLALLEPTTITASFSYRPAFTLNYIDIAFALDLSSNEVTLIEQT